MLEAVANLKWKNIVVQMPRLRSAVILAALDAPVLKIEVGKCILTKPAHVRKLGGDAVAAAAAEQTLDEANKWLDTHKVCDQVKWRALAELECDIVYFLTDVGEQSKRGQKHDSINHCARVIFGCVHNTHETHHNNATLCRARVCYIYIYIYIYIDIKLLETLINTHKTRPSLCVKCRCFSCVCVCVCVFTPTCRSPGDQRAPRGHRGRRRDGFDHLQLDGFSARQ